MTAYFRFVLRHRLLVVLICVLTTAAAVASLSMPAVARVESLLNAQRTFAFSGRAIMLTTVVLVLGFLPFALSNYFPIRMMGVLLPGVLLVALAADLLLVAALVQVGPLALKRVEKKQG